MYNRLTDILTASASKLPNPYGMVVTYNHKTESWDIKHPDNICIQNESAVMIERGGTLKDSIYACTQVFKMDGIVI